MFENLWKMIKHHPSSIIFTNIQTLMFFYVPTKDYSPKSFFCICSAIPNPTFTESEEISIIVSLHEHSIQPIINVYLTLRIDAKIFPENDLKPKSSCMSNKGGYNRRQLAQSRYERELLKVLMFLHYYLYQEFIREGQTETAIILCKLNKSL